MQVDLKRNDLGRTCEWETVAVHELLRIEDYSHVMHLVSDIKGSLRSDCNVLDLIRAMLSVGTLTGCRKVRLIEIVEEPEPMRRSLFFYNLDLLSDKRQFAWMKRNFSYALYALCVKLIGILTRGKLLTRRA